MTYRSVAILRGEEPGRAAELAVRCWEIGIDLVEVPVQGDAGWAALQRVAAAADGKAFGAGTVLTAEDARRAHGLGASVIISPGIDAEVVESALELGTVPLPGVSTPTEVTVAVRLGVRTCKFFPATVYGPAWLEAMRGPFPDTGFIAVGGVDPGNAKEFVARGATGVAFGSSIHALLGHPDPAGWVHELHALVPAA